MAKKNQGEKNERKTRKFPIFILFVLCEVVWRKFAKWSFFTHQHAIFPIEKKFEGKQSLRGIHAGKHYFPFL